MKLINPTDDELNANFAVWVAGWRNDPDEGWRNEHGVPITAVYYRDFTSSMDAVLPWLERTDWYAENLSHGRFGTVLVEINQPEKAITAEASSLPRACVIALLRANGVEVTFTT